MACVEHNNKSQHNPNRALRTGISAVAAVLLAAGTLSAVAACTPSNQAVGDTQSVNATPTHDALQGGTTVTVGLIGNPNGGADEQVLSACERDGIDATYISTEHKTGDELTQAQVAGIDDVIHRHMHIAMISGLELTDNNREALTAALQHAREAGVAVVLLNPVNEPEDETLYAAALRVNDRMMDAQPLHQVLTEIAADDAHDKDITVSTLG
ncbi:sugar ABC transporter substrate-binding protein [Bifidobacterium dolichotidis]|uniref:Sugar ABC transporter substrate-binding protein n=1 Tax=Bifidobacterium dolichotidis TaxID=2306976 RepID=A0A430FSD7_9BIFI|nr:sugar ABC transporter substrate-binding protein [Bifidobacterium dolichotidis]RSX55747.1 sugar ABC transporter substrate-binding protein [Bifidobacterium dolichotidis]